jgi:hypothetical protein
MLGQSLKNLVEGHGLVETTMILQECLRLGIKDPKHEQALRPDQFSLRELAEAFCGEQWVRRLNPVYANQHLWRMTAEGVDPGETRALLETGGAVDVSAFSNITGQILFTKILEGWELADMIGEELVETVPTVLDGEKLPFISQPLTEGGKVHPGQPYEEYGLAEEFIQTVPLNTYGALLSIHKLTVFYDRTGQLLKKANNLGKQLRYNKERRILNTLVQAASAPLFNWKGVSYVPFQTNGTYWNNLILQNPLVDYTSIEKVEIAATQILDPDLLNVGINTPIDIRLDSVVVMPFKKWTAWRALNAAEVRGVNLSPTPNIITLSPSPMPEYKLLTSKILYQQALATGATTAQAQDWWWMWDSKQRPIVYMENWPLQLIPQPPQSVADFERDIVFRLKASERGEPSWQDPRYIFFSKGPNG